MATGTAAREAALQILRAVRTGQRFDRVLDAALRELVAADRKLAHEIAAGVLRERSTLDRSITAVLTHPNKRLPDDLRDVLRIGVYQLSHLDRVPQYAAVQSTVELAKMECGDKFTSLVNALLRKLCTDLPTPSAAPTDTVEGLAEHYSHPSWLVARWTARFGNDKTEALLQHNNRRPALVVQPAQWTAERLATAFELADIEYRRTSLGDGLIVSTGNVTELPGYTEGGFVVQNPAQHQLLSYVAIPEKAVVWDACAAPGGKASVLAQTCTVLASDSSFERTGRLKENLHRAAPNALVVIADGRFPPFKTSRIDVVLVDTPCSSTGAIARHPDARWRLSESWIAKLARRQAGLLDGTATAVRPGGLLAYLTCSLEAEENEAQVDRFLQRHPEFSRECDDLLLFPAGGGDDADGGFAARLRRAA